MRKTNVGAGPNRLRWYTAKTPARACILVAVATLMVGLIGCDSVQQSGESDWSKFDMLVVHGGGVSLMNVESGTSRLLVDIEGTGVRNGDLNSSVGKVAFSEPQPTNYHTARLKLLDLESGKETEFHTAEGRPIAGDDPVWRPDNGEWLLTRGYSCASAGRMQIVNTRTEEVREQPHEESPVFQPQWSANGSHVSYVSVNSCTKDMPGSIIVTDDSFENRIRIAQDIDLADFPVDWSHYAPNDLAYATRNEVFRTSVAGPATEVYSADDAVDVTSVKWAAESDRLAIGRADGTIIILDGTGQEVDRTVAPVYGANIETLDLQDWRPGDQYLIYRVNTDRENERGKGVGSRELWVYDTVTGRHRFLMRSNWLKLGGTQ